MIVRSRRVTEWARHVGVSLNELDAVLSAWPVQSAWAFGSTVRADDTATSDIDIAVVVVPYGSGPTHPPKAFRVSAGLPIEWHCWVDMPAFLRAEVAATGIAIFESRPGEAELIAREAMTAWQRDASARAQRRAAELANARPLT